MSKPKVKREIRLAQVIAQSAAGFQEHFLGNIAGIHASRNCFVQSHVNHAPDRIAVAREQLIDGLRFAFFGFQKKILSNRRIGPHADYCTKDVRANGNLRSTFLRLRIWEINAANTP
jgi:hypothetical protein